MKTYIWSLPTRIFHWLLVIGMVTAYILSEEEELLNFHSSVGYMVGILIVFRIIWGIVGPKYSKFTDFPVSLNSIKNFATDMKGTKMKSPGHNPAASVVMLGIIIFTFCIVVSGILLLASEGQGFFAFVQTGLSEDALKETHEIAVNIVIGLVILHLLGNIVDFIFNNEVGTLKSMVTGYKNIEGESVKLNSFQKIFAMITLLVSILIVPYSIANQKISSEAEHSEQNNNSNNENEAEEDD